MFLPVRDCMDRLLEPFALFDADILAVVERRVLLLVENFWGYQSKFGISESEQDEVGLFPKVRKCCGRQAANQGSLGFIIVTERWLAFQAVGEKRASTSQGRANTTARNVRDASSKGCKVIEHDGGHV